MAIQELAILEYRQQNPQEVLSAEQIKAIMDKALGEIELQRFQEGREIILDAELTSNAKLKEADNDIMAEHYFYIAAAAEGLGVRLIFASVDSKTYRIFHKAGFRPSDYFTQAYSGIEKIIMVATPQMMLDAYVENKNLLIRPNMPEFQGDESIAEVAAKLRAAGIDTRDGFVMPTDGRPYVRSSWY